MVKFVTLVFLYLIALTISIPYSQCQELSFEKILTHDGEANLSVRQIIQDKNGFLWLATFSGLYRYEGDEYIIHHQFQNTAEINNDVTCLVQDFEHNIWIGTDYGLLKYNLDTEILQTYLHNPDDSLSISDNKIRDIDIDREGRLWIGTKFGGLNMHTPGNDGFISVQFDKSDEAPVFIRSILNARNGRIWVGTWGNGVYCFNFSGSSVDSVCCFRNDSPFNKLSNNYIYRLYEDTDGKIAVGTRNGLNVLDPETHDVEQFFSTPFPSAGEMTNYFRSVKRDRNGKLWIGTWGGLILCDNFSDLRSGNFQIEHHNRKDVRSISHDQIMNVFQDKSGCIWIGTENGLNKFDPYQNQLKRIGGEAIELLPEQTATLFYPYKKGVLILTLSHGILYDDGRSIQPIVNNNLFAQIGENLYALMVEPDGIIWLGGYNGSLIKLDLNSQSFTRFKHSRKNTPIYTLCQTDDGNILLGTSGEGLKSFNLGTKKFTDVDGLSGKVFINEMLIDRNKNLWVATELGIFRKKANNNSFECYLPDNPDTIASPNIFIDIAESANGEIFVGGRNGLYQYDDTMNTFETVKISNSERLWVTNIQFDSRQNIWLNLNFNRIAKKEPTSAQLSYFNVNNGIRSSQYNRRGFFINKANKLYLSGFDQIYEFDVADPLINKYSPPPVFTRLTINNENVHAGMELNDQKILEQSIQIQKNIRLNHLNKDFTLSFTSASYLNSKANKFKYILHGYDKEWHVSNEGSAHYTNLGAGKYIFEVFGANNDGYWSPESSRIAIHIKPAPWLSFWAFVIYVVLAAVSFYLLRRVIITRVTLKKELLIEKVKLEKEEKFNQERLRFYTNISHELRTPLTLIMGPIKQLIGNEKSGSKNYRLYTLILNNSERLLTLVNQLLDFRKSLHEGMKLKTTYSDIVSLVKSNIEAFDYMAAEKSISVHFSSESETILGWFDEQKLHTILFNILSNAFKYAPENGFVDTTMQVSQPNQLFPHQHVELIISNSGKGIQKSMQEKVFERFYRVVDTTDKTNTGSGIGLSLTKTLVELHKGKITLDSDPGKITTFTIYLPFNREIYSEDEIFDFKRDADRRTKEMVTNLQLTKNRSVIETVNSDLQKLLLIEDNKELRDFLAAYLSEEFKVLTANNGVDGLSLCQTEHPDLVISDIMMDKMDGLQFCKKVKSTVEISHIPIILMTAMASAENKMEGYKIGADDYITKPFEAELLKIRVNNILNKLSHIKNEFKNNIKVSANDLTISKIDEDFLNKVIELINKNLDNADFDMDAFCKNLGVSSSQLYRKIKSITGVSPNEFIKTYRLKEAARLISQTNSNVSEIAYKVGFNDALYFSKCFKKQFGISPSKYQ
jgi:signal transduction histidine kinase/ligand-binding sensor domain-containing protein/DNA-binding response OmpR family regulator